MDLPTMVELVTDAVLLGAEAWGASDGKGDVTPNLTGAFEARLDAAETSVAPIEVLRHEARIAHATALLVTAGLVRRLAEATGAHPRDLIALLLEDART